MKGRRKFCGSALCLAIVLSSSACKKSSAVSAEKAKASLPALAQAAHTDVLEVRTGLPQGVKFLLPLFETGKPASDDAQGARRALQSARNRVQDLRVAKSTFFALADAQGIVVRKDDDQDILAGRSLLPAFRGLEAALAGAYVETRGSLPELAGVRGRGDGQWLAAQPLSQDGAVKGLYVSGWSWSAYAYRLERALASNLRSTLGEGEKLPLVYVYLIVDRDVYGTPISPDVNARAIASLSPLRGASAATPTSFELTIDGREFGLALELAPDLGPNVAVAVLRSET